MAGFSSIKDMFDGGGAGKSGDKFEGGPLSGVLNSIGITPRGSEGGGGYTGLLDMVNGGGPGRAGQKFEGGLFSNLFNRIGVDPYGAADRLAKVRPMARPYQHMYDPQAALPTEPMQQIPMQQIPRRPIPMPPIPIQTYAPQQYSAMPSPEQWMQKYGTQAQPAPAPVAFPNLVGLTDAQRRFELEQYLSSLGGM